MTRDYQTQPPAAAEKLLLDTDIGSDIDDAVCLAYLLSQPRCELLGVTTVSGEPERRAMLASALCAAAGKPDIPIYPGRSAPLLGPQRQPAASQAEKLGPWPHRTDFPKGEAVGHMRKVIRENPGEVTLLAIGPLTNIAALFACDEELPGLLKRLVLMCGAFTAFNFGGGVCLTEWNALCDPHATAVVYSAPVNVRSVGLDVTTRVTMTKDEVEANFTADILRPVRDFAQVWFGHGGHGMTFHDPLAAAVIFDEGICSFERGNVSVEVESQRLRGFTYFERAADGKDEVALSVDKERFFAHYFGTVK
ncbi:MAG: nucleoside hydrolase [Firmicutes bacterium]|nr:nucleoside hydrolase [Bacillota bacterium]